MELNGRVAAITGASSGIGLAISTALAREGVAVVLGARREDRLDAAVDAIRAAGGRAARIVMDVTREEDCERLVERAQAVFGPLDIMVCNAGFGYYGTVEQTPPETMRRMMDVNFMGTFLGARAALPGFRARGRGHLVIISSIVGQRGIAQMSGYSATKAAQAGFAEGLRTEFTGSPIHISIVYPISTETEFRSAMTRDYGHAVSGLGPTQTADDVASAVVECIRRPRVDVYPHSASRLLTMMNAVAPGLTDRFVKRFGRRREWTGGSGEDRGSRVS
jgi:short-subunit dehydrogenase